MYLCLKGILSDPIYRQILSSSVCSHTVQPMCDLIGIWCLLKYVQHFLGH